MNHPFLLPPRQLDQAMESDGSLGGGRLDLSTRRRFLKLTGGATVASMIAIQRSRASAPGKKDHCSKHGSYCRYIKSVKVVFNGVTDYPSEDTEGEVVAERCGRIFTGTLTYVTGSCKEGEEDETSNGTSVTCGGYLRNNRHIVRGPNSDTALPEDTYDLPNQPSGGSIPGFEVSPQPPNRTEIEVHDRQRPKGSSGCIAFTDPAGDGGDWDDFNDLLQKNHGCPCAPKPVPMEVSYDLPEGTPGPSTTWKQGHVPGSTTCCQ
jgi:hypothetical protein